MRRVIGILLVILTFIYWIGTQNFYLGSNSKYCKTIFDDDVLDCWYCDQYDLHGKEMLMMTDDMNVSEKKYMCVYNENDEKKLYIFARGKFLIDIYYADVEKAADVYRLEQDPICTSKIRYKKRFGKICGFEVYEFPVVFSNRNMKKTKVVFKKMDA